MKTKTHMIKERVQKLFPRDEVNVAINKLTKRTMVTIDSIHSTDSIEFPDGMGFLDGLLALRTAMGTKELNMPSHYKDEGCPTCGAGESGHWEFEGW